MTTWTIDDMPESQRPKRNVFRSHTEAQPPAAQPAPAPPAKPAAEPDLSDYLHRSDLDRFRILIMDALAGFPAARASVLEAIKRAFRETLPEGALA